MLPRLDLLVKRVPGCRSGCIWACRCIRTLSARSSAGVVRLDARAVSHAQLHRAAMCWLCTWARWLGGRSSCHVSRHVLLVRPRRSMSDNQLVCIYQLQMQPPIHDTCTMELDTMQPAQPSLTQAKRRPGTLSKPPSEPLAALTLAALTRDPSTGSLCSVLILYTSQAMTPEEDSGTGIPPSLCAGKLRQQTSFRPRRVQHTVRDSCSSHAGALPAQPRHISLMLQLIAQNPILCLTGVCHARLLQTKAACLVAGMHVLPYATDRAIGKAASQAACGSCPCAIADSSPGNAPWHLPSTAVHDSAMYEKWGGQAWSNSGPVWSLYGLLGDERGRCHTFPGASHPEPAL